MSRSRRVEGAAAIAPGARASRPPSLRASVIIATYNRPRHLHDCLASLLEQTELPLEVIVVDDGRLPEPPLQGAFEAKGVRYLYRRKSEPGLTASRNLGVSSSRGDVLCFLDDDVVLEPDYLERILDVYRDDPRGAIGGVGGGRGARPGSALAWMRRIYNLVFLISGVRAGRVLPSTFCTNLGEGLVGFERPVDAEFLGGAGMSFRREVFDRFRFTPGYNEIAVGEDKDFSYRVHRAGYRLILTPLARLRHDEAQEMRPNLRMIGHRFVLGRYLFFRDHGRRDPLSWMLFWYALSGYALSRLAVAVATRQTGERERLRGIVAAVADIAAGRVAAPPPEAALVSPDPPSPSV